MGVEIKVSWLSSVVGQLFPFYLYSFWIQKVMVCDQCYMSGGPVIPHFQLQQWLQPQWAWPWPWAYAILSSQTSCSLKHISIFDQDRNQLASHKALEQITTIKGSPPNSSKHFQPKENQGTTKHLPYIYLFILMEGNELK